MKAKKARSKKPTPIKTESWEETRQQNMARVAKTLDLPGIKDDSERSFLATCQLIYRRNTGSDTPFEEFFCRLVYRAQYGRWPTPDDVDSCLAGFKESFDCLHVATNKFIATYPELVDVLQPAKEEANAA